MLMLERRLASLLALASLLVLPALAAAQAGALVSADWLQKRMGDPDLLVLDASSTKLHMAKHIPGAVGVDLYRYGAPYKSTPADVEKRIQSWGVSPGKTIVVYDEGASIMGTWLFWELQYHGYPLEKLHLLDGGLAAWERAGGAVTKEPTPPPPPGTFRVAQLREDTRTRLPQFLVATGDKQKHAVVDALDAPYYYGETRFFELAGHVPGAVLMPAAEFFNADKTFKSPEEIRKMAAFLGIRADQEIHSHCGGGVAATTPWFALRHVAGFPQVKVYKESQFEWLRDERGLPFRTYADPTLRRDMGWLNAWTAPMLRMFDVAEVSIVDVRPEEAYRLNHVPYSVHLAEDTMRAALTDPGKLVPTLERLGVNPADEAVIVSEAGLTPRAALAFVLLEKAGQRRVSVMADSVDDWGMKGYPLTKQPTVVGKRTSPQDTVLKPVTYAASPRAGVVSRDAPAAGAYPTVYVAAGAKAPSKAPPGKLVHVPYTELVTPTGNAKPAYEVWKILSKAGVPRYARIVVLADDPGEAAVNYVVLRMMGFPDVQVLASGA